MGQEIKEFDWKEKAVYYSKDLLLGNPIVTYYDKNLEVVNCERKDQISDPLFLESLEKK
jgi:hypothetical protein